jgi:hypothetical protein
VYPDWTENYRAGSTILAVLAGVGLLFFLMAKPPKLGRITSGGQGVSGKASQIERPR